MTKDELIEALKALGRGRIDVAEAIAEYLMPEPKTVQVEVPAPAKRKKAE